MGKGFGLGSFVLGGLVGAAAALLFAPRTGEQTRALVADKVDELWGEGEKIYSQGRERVMDGVSQVQPVVARKNDELREKIENARRAIADQVARNAAAAKDAISDKIPVTAEKIEQAADVVRGKMDEAAAKLKGVAADIATKDAEAEKITSANLFSGEAVTPASGTVGVTSVESAINAAKIASENAQAAAATPDAK